MDSKFEALKGLGAGEFEHLNGSLIQHLNSTTELLEKWGASTDLSDAGLYHAAYGTTGFDTQIVNLDMRSQIAEIIGIAAESIVYLYCSCDRDFVFTNIENDTPIQFRDRFTYTEFILAPKQAKEFCELTVANEMELVLSSTKFKEQHGEGLFQLFGKMECDLSSSAISSYIIELSDDG
jgi:hypothetical protein